MSTVSANKLTRICQWLDGHEFGSKVYVEQQLSKLPMVLMNDLTARELALVLRVIDTRERSARAEGQASRGGPTLAAMVQSLFQPKPTK